MLKVETSPSLSIDSFIGASAVSTRPSPITRRLIEFPVTEPAADRGRSRTVRERRTTSFMSRTDRDQMISNSQTTHLVLSSGIGASVEILDGTRLKDVGVKVKFAPNTEGAIKDCQAIELALNWKAEGGRTRLSFDPSFLKELSKGEYQFTLANVVRITLRTVDTPARLEAELGTVADLALERFTARAHVGAEYRASSSVRKAS